MLFSFFLLGFLYKAKSASVYFCDLMCLADACGTAHHFRWDTFLLIVLQRAVFWRRLCTVRTRHATPHTQTPDCQAPEWVSGCHQHPVQSKASVMPLFFVGLRQAVPLRWLSFRGGFFLALQVDIQSSLDHPNIVKLYEVFQDAKRFPARREEGAILRGRTKTLKVEDL